MRKLNRPSTSSEPDKTAFIIGLFSTELIVVLALFGCLTIFFILVKLVLIDHNQAFDQTICQFIEPYSNATTTRIMAAITELGGTRFMLPANILLILYFLFIRKHRWYSIKIGAIALSSVLMMHLLKLIFNRPRPLIPLLEPAIGLSFPSGHAMTSVTFFGLLIYFVHGHTVNKIVRILLICLLVALILLIGISRIYLRVHYPSDVLAGYCMGVVWLILSLEFLNRMERRK
ncbi:phosphatase PAP2 family protein [Arcticibacter eurypsychrophilus]|uniref:phosphatase PAP2 family protein n=1 Tax=Arcticibacter eurypsychrophilus TaxID=1434752 RepID=UPI000AE59930|nr:phosphatase PAP2 family protein [Arcticibacter eurypsychrophilus]